MYLFLDIYLEANGTLKRNRKFLQLPSSAGQYFNIVSSVWSTNLPLTVKRTITFHTKSRKTIKTTTSDNANPVNGQTTQWQKKEEKKKNQRANNDLQSIHIKLKIELHEPH